MRLEPHPQFNSEIWIDTTCIKLEANWMQIRAN